MLQFFPNDSLLNYNLFVTGNLHELASLSSGTQGFEFRACRGSELRGPQKVQM